MSYYKERLDLPVSDKFRARFYTSFSQRKGAISNFVKKVKSYAGEFITKDDSFNLRYNDVVIIIKNGVLINLFKRKAND